MRRGYEAEAQRDGEVRGGAGRLGMERAPPPPRGTEAAPRAPGIAEEGWAWKADPGKGCELA